MVGVGGSRLQQQVLTVGGVNRWLVAVGQVVVTGNGCVGCQMLLDSGHCLTPLRDEKSSKKGLKWFKMA